MGSSKLQSHTSIGLYDILTRRVLRSTYAVLAIAITLSAATAPAAAAEPAASEPGADAADKAFFEGTIQPLLVSHCYDCHSHESGEASGGLVLDSLAAPACDGPPGIPLILPTLLVVRESTAPPRAH